MTNRPPGATREAADETRCESRERLLAISENTTTSDSSPSYLSRRSKEEKVRFLAPAFEAQERLNDTTSSDASKPTTELSWKYLLSGYAMGAIPPNQPRDPERPQPASATLHVGSPRKANRTWRERRRAPRLESPMQNSRAAMMNIRARLSFSPIGPSAPTTRKPVGPRLRAESSLHDPPTNSIVKSRRHGDRVHPAWMDSTKGRKSQRPSSSVNPESRAFLHPARFP